MVFVLFIFTCLDILFLSYLEERIQCLNMALHLFFWSPSLKVMSARNRCYPQKSHIASYYSDSNARRPHIIVRRCIQVLLFYHLVVVPLYAWKWIHALSPTLDSFKMPAALPVTSDSFSTISLHIFIKKRRWWMLKSELVGLLWKSIVIRCDSLRRHTTTT